MKYQTQITKAVGEESILEGFDANVLYYGVGYLLTVNFHEGYQTFSIMKIEDDKFFLDSEVWFAHQDLAFNCFYELECGLQYKMRQESRINDTVANMRQANNAKKTNRLNFVQKIAASFLA